MKTGKMITQLMSTGRFTLEDRENLQQLEKGDLEVLLGLYLDIEDENKVKFILRASGVMVNSIRHWKTEGNEKLLQESYRIVGVLNKEIHKICDLIEDNVTVDDFLELFELVEGTEEDDWCFQEDEDYYSNIMSSTSDIGHIVRTALIQSESKLFEILS